MTWWKDHLLLDDTFEVLPDGSVKNVLHLPRINRQHLHTVSKYFVLFERDLCFQTRSLGIEKVTDFKAPPFSAVVVVVNCDYPRQRRGSQKAFC